MGTQTHKEAGTTMEVQLILREIERELQDMAEEEKQDALDFIRQKKKEGAA